ncbi:AAA family ATPase [Microcoleus vaginatus]|uniref:AAA family ATPase n=1 Tax=Microcoleus vaginatus TaxID=119532 RepID=UPI001F61D347|nr:GAF domain-containing protein [Microcoleus vaginatus HSN003]
MIILPGYTIAETLYEGDRTVVYRGIRERDRQPVILKMIKDEYPNIEEITRFRQEYAIPQKLDVPGIVKPYNLVNYENSFALVLEDFGGQSVSELLKNIKIHLQEFLLLAISLVETLSQVHKVGIIHKDIKPSNIIINPETREVKITDFSIAIALPKEQQSIVNPNLLEGTLAYMSPEQTGRMNRAIDYRTDFYSLGVTFYEMLTNQLPFTTTDPMELVYCHIAKQPVPPKEVAEIPQAVSDIVMKLLAKNAEDRYQSAAGLKFDMETCLQQLQTTGNIENFPIGQRDRGNQLLIPQKLYGRETEVQILLDAFGRVSLGATEMMLVSGYSGIGKTSIVNEVHKPIVAARGYFIAGKFDQFKRNIPYAALIQAFQELVRQLLTESSEQIAIWKENLLKALDNNGQVIIDVIPEVELIIGKQPEVPQLGSSESQNRFNRVFQQFIRVFCQPEHPLVIFLDDLQWADAASLKLIQLLVTDPDSKYLLTIGAYRDNEVSPVHPLIQTIEKIQENETVVNNITIQALALDSVNHLIADTLDASVNSEQIKLFSELLFNKTQGNPFFLTQLLKTLYSENLLVYQVDTDRWEWDIQQIQAIGIADFNIVELVARNIRKLPETTQKALKLAACIGNQFNLEVLSIVNEESNLVTAAHLWEAMQAGLILPLSESYKIPLVFAQEELASVRDIKVEYKFLHDRVQQAAYSLIPESEKKATHLKIGQLLLNNTTEQERKDNIFALVNQLNFGTDLLTNQSETDELAELNLIAGQKAKAATAYEAAVNYLNVGIELLSQDSWESRYDLTFTFYLEAAEAEYLNANLERAEILCDRALQKAKTILEQVQLYELKIKLKLAKNQIQSALDTGLQVLEMLGVTLSQSPPQELKIEELASLPEMTDPYKLAAMQILILIWPPACFGDAKLSLPILYTMIDLSSQYGNSSPAIYAYCNYGGIVTWQIPDIDFGYQLGQLALNVLDKLNAKEFRCKALLTYCITIQHWKQHTRNTIEPLRQAIQDGLEVGDIEFACHTADFYCAHLFFVGEHLEFVAERLEQYIDFVNMFKQEYQLNLLKIFGQAVSNIREGAENKCELIGNTFNEIENLPLFIKENNVIYLLYIYFLKSRLCYLFKDYSGCLENAELAAKYSHFVRNIILFTEHIFYYSLALVAQYGNTHDREDNENNLKQQQYLKQVEENQQKMKYWAFHCPANYQHKYDLVEAEKARVLGQCFSAMEYYDLAIDGAKENGYVQDEALANELAAEFYLALGRQKVARTYLIDAYYAYIRWGAKAKVKDLEERHAELLAPIVGRKNSLTSGRDEMIVQTRTTVTSTSSGAGQALDLSTIIKASQALSGEVHLDKLLSNLMQFLLENAGAEKFYFLIPDPAGKWKIEAQCTGERCQLISKSATESQEIPISLVNYVERTQETLAIDDATNKSRFAFDPYIIQQRPKSILCSPLINQGKLVGILYLENNLTAGAFTRDRLEVLNIISAQAAISIENARLYQTLEDKVQQRTAQLAEANQEISALNNKLKAENIRLSAELEVTKRLQQMILPKQSELDKIKGLEIAGYMQPADEVGGDYYDVLTQNDKVKISIGDVTGHGLESGVLMIMAQTAVRTLQQMNETDPVNFLDVLNRTLYANIERIGSSRNMTLALLDYQDSNFSLSGQHEELIVVRTDGNIELIDTMELGFPLGLEEDISGFVSQIQVHLNPGDVVVLYTDGITEAININRVYYGIERLCKLVKENRHKTVEEIRQAVIDDVRQHIDKQKVFDDITLVVLKQK